MHASPVVEVVLFNIKPDIEEAAFLASVDSVTQVLQAMPGYLRRELLKDASGQWIDLVYWQSHAEATQAAQAIMTIPDAQPFIAMLDERTISMLHLTQLRTYP